MKYAQFLFCLFLLAITPLTVASEEIKLAIGTSAWQNVFKKIQTPFEQKTGIKIVPDRPPTATPVSAEEGFKLVEEGKVEGAIMGSHWEGWLDVLKDKGIEPKNKANITVRVVGKDLMQIYTWKEGPKKLTEEQILAVFTGKIKNWKEIGGLDAPVVIIASESHPFPWRANIP